MEISPIVTALTFAGLVLLFWALLTQTVLGRGFSVPLKNLFRKVETAQYPEQPRGVAERFHGRHQLNRYDDGLEKCIGCELCAWACPADAIYVQGADNTEEARFSPGERYAEDYQINYNRCILCGLCIEACPTRALTMTDDFEFSADNRSDLVWTKQDLLAPLQSGAVSTPHTDREVRERGLNYYGGLAVTPPTLHGGSYAPAANAPAARAGQIVPTGRLPSVDQEPADPATVGESLPPLREQSDDAAPASDEDASGRER